MKSYYFKNELLTTDYRDCSEGQDIEIKGEWYRVLRIQWVGAYDYQVILAPVARIFEYVN